LQTTRGLINPPLGANGSSVQPSSFAEEREEALTPAVDGAAVNHSTTFGKPLHPVSGAQPVATIPAYSQGDDIIREGTRRTGGETAAAAIAAPTVSAKSGLPILACPLALTPNALHDSPSHAI
jgi:hypothetical protein